MGWRKKNMDGKKVGDREESMTAITIYTISKDLRDNSLSIFQFLKKLLSASVSKCGN